LRECQNHINRYFATNRMTLRDNTALALPLKSRA
jgi:hypothetical protein